jgi:MFS family permease
VEGLHRRLALLVAGAFFMEILDGTVIAPAAPHMALDLGVRAVDINLAVSAYLLTLAMLIPISGWLADRFGVRTVFMAALAIFTVASAGCALAVNLPMLTATRVLQGAGAGSGSGARRRPQRVRLVAVDLRHQPAARGRRPGAGQAHGSGSAR